MKVAFVIQRYGQDVGGGSELFCRQIAEHMSKHWDIEVLTTCAADYITWADRLEPGVQTLNGVKVRRFRVDFPRTVTFFDRIGRTMDSARTSPQVEALWFREQGPYSSDFLRYLDENADHYDLFVFFTYLYGFTYFGLPKVAAKSVLIPTAHDEPPFYLESVQKLMRLPRGMIFLTPEERDFVHSQVGTDTPHQVISVGIDPPPEVDASAFRKHYGITGKYVLYLGRIDPSKGCGEMFKLFQHFRHEHPALDLKLVLAGAAVMPVPVDPSILSLGFIDESLKASALAGAELLLMPSHYESLSLVTLEAWNLGTPALVNGKCEVLRGQVGRSGGGRCYTTYEEFEAALEEMTSGVEIKRGLGEAGRKYVREHYRWEGVEESYLGWAQNLLKSLTQSKRR